MTERRQGRIFIVAQDAVKISDMANISKAGYFPLIFVNVCSFVIGDPHEAQGVAHVC